MVVVWNNADARYYDYDGLGVCRPYFLAQFGDNLRAQNDNDRHSIRGDRGIGNFEPMNKNDKATCNFPNAKRNRTSEMIGVTIRINERKQIHFTER
jgi:hypothetical protein